MTRKTDEELKDSIRELMEDMLEFIKHSQRFFIDRDMNDFKSMSVLFMAGFLLMQLKKESDPEMFRERMGLIEEFERLVDDAVSSGILSIIKVKVEDAETLH